LSFYDEFYQHAETSAAHAEFCRRVYGRDLAQHGMLDMKQVDLLLETIPLGAGFRVLELGCGSGRLAEHLAGLTGAEITGLDQSTAGIAIASERAARRGAAWPAAAMPRGRLHFLCANVATYDYPAAAFDLVLAVDLLAFMRDLPALLTRLAPALRRRGQLAAFHSVWASADESDGQLSPRSNRLGLALLVAGWRYKVHDLREEEIAHWQRKLAVLAEMRAEFEAEGNEFIYERRLVEAEFHQRYVKTGRLGRYLYIAQPG
jgi:cyclopropane fatty-acyl-phospholipid synthase-like methyltransferase